MSALFIDPPFGARVVQHTSRRNANSRPTLPLSDNAGDSRISFRVAPTIRRTA